MQHNQHVLDWIAHASLLQVAGCIIALDDEARTSKVQYVVALHRTLNEIDYRIHAMVALVNA